MATQVRKKGAVFKKNPLNFVGTEGNKYGDSPQDRILTTSIIKLGGCDEDIPQDRILTIQ